MASIVSETKRPDVVTAIGELRILAGIFAVGFGLYLATSASGFLKFTGDNTASYDSREELVLTSIFTGSFFVIQGIVGAIVGIGMLSRKKWAWTANIILSIVIILLAATDVALGTYRSVLALIFNASILAYTLTKPARIYFGIERLPLFSSGVPETTSAF